METTQIDQSQDNLVDLVRKQIEYYFSAENLQSDAYLVQHMDSNRSVPISVVMKFAKLKALTQDESIVRQALAQSTVAVVGDRIKANVKPAGRSTVILRDVSSTASEESVREIFNYPGAKPIVSLRSDIGDTWFVTFESEQDAKDCLLDIKLKKRLFNGEPVKARIKTENVVRSYYSVPTMPPISPYGVYPMGMPYGAPVDMQAYGYAPVPAVNGAEAVNAAGDAQSAAAVDGSAAAVSDDHKQRNGSAGFTANNGRGAARTARTNAAGSASNNNAGGRDREGRRAGGEGRRSANGNGDRANNGREKEGSNSGSSSNKKSVAADKPAVEINAVSFPPLQTVDETPVPAAGYSTPYVKYSLDEIIAIVKEVKEASIPVEVDAAAHSMALTVEPNLDLLRRQRTFSIDETREQLRQGRPVLKDAIIPGAVDYKSMMYGEHDKTKKSGEHDNNKKESAASAHSHVAESASTAAHESSSSSWAALVKSTASIELAPASATAAPVKTSTTSSPVKKSAAASNNSNTNNSKDSSAAAAQKDASASTSSSNNKKSEKREGDKKKSKDEKKKDDKEHKDDAHVISWGGKASFANVLKQNLDEVAPTTEVVKKAAAPKSTTTATTTTKTSSSNNNNSNNSNNNNKARRSETEGKWTKETLPPVADK